MSNVYFNTLSGMMAASFGLKTVSDNVANMQSPGFKGQTVFYSSLGSNGYSNNLGNGVSSGESKINFKQGNITQSGVQSQMAIDGRGFFIIEMKNGEYLYTRDGEFSFNDDGYLIDEHSGGYVMGHSESGQLTRITSIGDEKNPGKMTSEVSLKGNIYAKPISESSNSSDTTTDPTKSLFEDVTINNIEIFDANGNPHTLTLVFKVDGMKTGNQYQLNKLILKEVSENGNILFSSGGSFEYELNYSNGYPADKHIMEVKLRFGENTEQTVTFDFGKYDSSDGAKVVKLLNKETGTTETTKVEISKQDGYGEGRQYDYAFDENGQISYLYTNQQTTKGIHVALAHFDNPQAQLQAVSNNAFRAKVRDGMHIGKANDGVFGSIKPQYLELSNVDSTNEFANIVILQRMFQACSQVMEIDKQLLEELYKK